MAVGEGVLQAVGARRTTEKLLMVVGIVVIVVGVALALYRPAGSSGGGPYFVTGAGVAVVGAVVAVGAAAVAVRGRGE